MSKYTISSAMMNRLPLYLDYLHSLKDQKIKNISATKVSKDMGLGEVLVRKEFGVISGNGKPRLGYKVSDLIKDFDKFLNVDKTTKAIILGAGRLGKALLSNKVFVDFGVEILAAFDINEKEIDNKKIFNVSKLKKFVSDNDVQIGIITVPKDSAEKAYKDLVNVGVKGIWNFSLAPLKKIDGVVIKQENLALSLAHLNIMMKNELK